MYNSHIYSLNLFKEVKGKFILRKVKYKYIKLKSSIDIHMSIRLSSFNDKIVF